MWLLRPKVLVAFCQLCCTKYEMLQQTYLQPQQGFVKRSREECIQQVLMHKCKAKHSTTEAEPKMKKQYQTEENAA